MDIQAFTGGVKPGGLTADHEVRILVCYLLHHISRPLSFAEINDVMQIEGVANYFEYAQAISKLVETGHIIIEISTSGEELYKIAPLGIKTSEGFEKALPSSVREGILKTTSQYLLQKKLERENKVTIKKQDKGFLVSMAITDMGSDLLAMSIYVPSEADCDRVKKNFLNDPATIYRGVVGMLTGDEFTIRSILSKSLDDEQGK